MAKHGALAITAHVLTRLAKMTETERIRQGLPYHAAASRIGIAKSALQAFVGGRDARLDTVLKVIEWLRESGEPVEPSTTLTGAAQQVLDLLRQHDGLGECWLRVEQRSYGLVLPDADGTLGELSRVRGMNWATWGELEASGVVERGLPSVMPAIRGPRNRAKQDLGYPIKLTRRDS